MRMRSTNLAKNSPERLTRRRAASSCNAFATATFSSCVILSFTNQVTKLFSLLLRYYALN